MKLLMLGGLLAGLSLAVGPQDLSAQTRPERTVTIEPDGCSATTSSSSTSCVSGPGSVEDAVRQLYSDLPNSEITTGVLYDRAMPIVDAGQFDGTAGTPVMNGHLWKTAYRDLYEAAHDARGMESPADIAAATEAAPENVVPIIVSYIDFNAVDYEAYADYRLDFDDKDETFVRGSNDVSPYVRETFFSAAPAVSKVNGTDVTFHVDQDYYTTNQNATPQYFRIDFGDGAGLQRVDWGEQVTAYYDGTGVKEVRVEAVYDEVTREARFELPVAPSNTDLDSDSKITDENKRAFYEGEEVFYEYYGIYGQDGEVLDKPVVLLDGIDFADVVDTEEGPREFEDIVDLFDREVELPDGTTHRALTDLHNDGYDIFVLNYADGADHIRRNAFALVDLLENIINERTGGREQIVVVGPSMGGVVSRYALSYMEDTGKEHNVRLFISYDSPQQGANVTVGIQKMISALPGILQGQVEKRRAMLNRPAAKELDKFYGLNGVDDVHPLRQQLLDELETYGDYPDDDRLTKVAVANGSGYGRSQEGDEGQDMDAGDPIFKMTIGAGATVGLGYDYEADVYAAPDRVKDLVYQSDHYVTVGLWRFRARVKVPGVGANREVNTPPYDSAPGGWRAFARAAHSSSRLNWWQKGLHVGLGLINIYALADADTDYPVQSFIPTVSALAYNTSHPDPYNQYGQNYYYEVMRDSESEQRARSPFDDLVAHQENTKHVLVTPTSYEFVMRHIYHVDESITVDGQTFNDPEPTFKAKQTITAENTTAKSGAELALRAGESITLGPGFKVEKGATFSARVDPSLQDAGEPPQTSTTATLASTGPSPQQQSTTRTSESEAKKKENGAATRAAAAAAREGAIPVEYGLSSNYPNPFRETTRLRYELPEEAPVTIAVYDMLGRRVETLVNERKLAGYHRVRFDATALASGTYFCRLKAGDFVATETMVLVK